MARKLDTVIQRDIIGSWQDDEKKLRRVLAGRETADRNINLGVGIVGFHLDVKTLDAFSCIDT